MHHYIFHLGSNIGDRKDNLLNAVRMMSEKIGSVVHQSSIYETEPWGLKEQPLFLNMAIEVTSKLSPHEVMTITKSIEAQLGRVKTEKWAERRIDIDTIYCDDMIIKDDKITLPHPELYNRNFVLIPLMEIAGDKLDPVKQLTIDDLYLLSEDTCEVFLFEEE